VTRAETSEIDDNSVTVHGGHQDGLRFHEVEPESARDDDRAGTVLGLLWKRVRGAASVRPEPAGSPVGTALIVPSDILSGRIGLWHLWENIGVQSSP
jgi:hypothetical protein